MKTKIRKEKIKRLKTILITEGTFITINYKTRLFNSSITKVRLSTLARSPEKLTEN